jgi:putative DNA primase/helicase
MKPIVKDPYGLPEGEKLSSNGVAGAWAPIAARVQAQHASETRFRCPLCGYPDILSVRVRPGCKPLLHCFNGCERPALYNGLNCVAGTSLTPPAGPSAASLEKRSAENQERALKLWATSSPAIGTKAETYLKTRKIGDLATSQALRFHGDVSHPKESGRFPAMIALVVDVNGSPLGVHRTYLAADGCGKAATTPQRACLGPIKGGVIRLTDFSPGTRLIIGEGIETAASAGLLIKAPAWAALSAGNLEWDVMLPAEVREVVIAVDPDRAGRRAASAAADRWRRKGARVDFVLPGRDHDFNDVLCGKTKVVTNV